MMASLTVEGSKGSGFATTYGFCAPEAMPTGGMPCAGSNPATSMPGGVQLSVPPVAVPRVVVGFKPAASHHAHAEHASTRPHTWTPAPPLHPDDRVGWKGLVEMSRSTGAAGNLDCRRKPGEEDVSASTEPLIEVVATAHPTAAVRRLVKSVTRGLLAHQDPEAATEGMGGTYFFCNEAGRKAAILKPCDEEPLAPNNPKGYVGRQLGDPGWKPTVRVGEAAMREVAAFLLDRDNFARVPTSVLVRARHPIFCYNVTGKGDARMASGRWGSVADLVAAAMAGIADRDAGAGPGPVAAVQQAMKLGSLQEFVPHSCDTSEMGAARFSVSDVHRIGILDIRIFNTDRHAGNMLVRSTRDAAASSANVRASAMVAPQYELIPIDHGFCLPETLDAPYFEWLHWPQAMLPFSEEELAYIASLDADEDRELLARELPILRPECVRVLELTTSLLKRCAEAGLTLFEIGSVLSRPFESNGDEADLSELERMCRDARAVRAMGQIDEEGEGEGDESECEGGGESGSESGDECEEGGVSGERVGVSDDNGGVGERVGRGNSNARRAAREEAAIDEELEAELLGEGAGAQRFGAATSLTATHPPSRLLMARAAHAATSGGGGGAAASAFAPASTSRAYSSEEDPSYLMFELDGGEESSSLSGAASATIGAFTAAAAAAASGQPPATAAVAAAQRLTLANGLSVYTKAPPPRNAETSPTVPFGFVESPSAYSAGSSSYSSLEFVRGAGLSPVGMPIGGGNGHGNTLALSPTLSPTLSSAAAAAPMAHSVHGNGMMSRAGPRASARRARAGRHGASGASLHRRKSGSGSKPAVYPPPVYARGGGGSDAVSFAAFDGPGWAAFKGVVLQMVDDAIACGRWRADGAAGGLIAVASSCPRF
ncbi:hypothetical protein FOA52_002158 [Chlamydomonas sp. UWO 241]|nr:hypothetical protein FOA52_002158 [Chlamydomonas sp. UWO 241]